MTEGLSSSQKKCGLCRQKCCRFRRKELSPKVTEEVKGSPCVKGGDSRRLSGGLLNGGYYFMDMRFFIVRRNNPSVISLCSMSTPFTQGSLIWLFHCVNSFIRGNSLIRELSRSGKGRKLPPFLPKGGENC